VRLTPELRLRALITLRAEYQTPERTPLMRSPPQIDPLYWLIDSRPTRNANGAYS